MVDAITKETEMTELQWLEKGYVLKKGCKGRTVFYYRANKDITFYKRDEVIHREDWANARKKKRKDEANKKARQRYIIKKTNKEIQRKDYNVVTCSLWGEHWVWQEERYEENYRGHYDYIVEDEERFNAIQVDDEFTIPNENGGVEALVVKKEKQALWFDEDCNPLYDYKTIDGKRFNPTIYKDYRDIKNRITKQIERKRRNRKKRK